MDCAGPIWRRREEVDDDDDGGGAGAPLPVSLFSLGLPRRGSRVGGQVEPRCRNLSRAFGRIPAPPWMGAFFVGPVPGQEGTAELTAQPQREKTVMRAHSQPTGACMITEIDCQNNEQSGCLSRADGALLFVPIRRIRYLTRRPPCPMIVSTIHVQNKPAWARCTLNALSMHANTFHHFIYPIPMISPSRYNTSSQIPNISQRSPFPNTLAALK